MFIYQNLRNGPVFLSKADRLFLSLQARLNADYKVHDLI